MTKFVREHDNNRLLEMLVQAHILNQMVKNVNFSIFGLLWTDGPSLIYHDGLQFADLNRQMDHDYLTIMTNFFILEISLVMISCSPQTLNIGTKYGN